MIRSGTSYTALAFLAKVERRSKGVAANAARERPDSRERGCGLCSLYSGYGDIKRGHATYEYKRMLQLGEVKSARSVGR